MKRRNNGLGRLVLVGALTLFGTGCSKELEKNPKEYAMLEGSFVQIYSNGGKDTRYIFEVDGDGIADAIGEFRGEPALYAAPDFRGVNYCRIGPNTKTMTPEEIAAATKALKADQDLAFILSKRQN